MKQPEFRTDIQALRGFAVLLVLFYHAKLPRLHAGYLGVDVFFVLSGFLITRIIKEAIEAERFSFGAFYWRRAKRLLPASMLTFLLTALVAPLLLTTLELKAFTGQLAGALTLSGNIVLWQQTGYFAGAAELKPLLHVWSLGLEEQYYLLLPATLVFVPRRHWLTTALLIGLGSLAICLVLLRSDPSAAFYLLPPRAFELAIGSAAALAVPERGRTQALLAHGFWPAVGVLLLAPFLPPRLPHPGLVALLVCLATLLIVLARHRALNRGLLPVTLALVGNISYSLYLVHWPIFAFLRNAYLGELPRRTAWLAVGLSLLAGFALYRMVEVPFRRSALRFSGKVVLAGLGVLVLALLPPLLVSRARARANYAEIRRINYGLGSACETEGRFRPKPECTSTPAPRLLVWGDSYAMHLVPGLLAVTNTGVMQATRSRCGPFLDFAAIHLSIPELDRSWTEQCLEFNRSVFDALKRLPSIEVVVLSGELGKYVGPAATSEYRSVTVSGGEWTTHPPTVAGALAAMRETARRIRSLGKRVVLVAPMPSGGFDIGICHERKATGLLILGVDRSCRFPSATLRGQPAQQEFLDRLAGEAGVNAVRFESVLCDRRFCVTELDGIPLYRDGNHLSYDGSRALARHAKLGELLEAAAR